MRQRVITLGALLAAAALVAMRYRQVQPPGSLVMLLALVAFLILLTVAAVGLGAPGWRWISGRRLDGIEAGIVAAAIGSGLLAAAAGALGAAGVLGRTSLVTVLLAAAGAGVYGLWRDRVSIRIASHDLPLVPALICGVSALVTLLVVSVPGLFYDQFHYHLAFPERWLRVGRIDVFPRHSYSYFPANMGLLFDYGLATFGVAAAQAINWWAGALALLATARIARTLGAGPFGAWWAATLLAATPAVMITATWAGSDLGTAAFAGVAWLLVVAAEPATERRSPGAPWRQMPWFAVTGGLCGLAVGCKYLALATVAVPVGLAVALGAIVEGRRSGGVGRLVLRRVVPWGAGLVATFAPWAIRNALLTGDPVYPFFASLFLEIADNPALREAAGLAAGIARPPEPGTALMAVLTLRTFNPQGAAGLIGPVWLAAVPSWLIWTILVRRDRRVLMLIAGVATGIVLWSRFNELGRYLIPVLVPAAAGIATAFDELQREGSRRLRLVLVSVLTLLTAWGAFGGINRFGWERISCAFGLDSIDAMMARYVSYWPAIPFINESLPADAKLLFVAEARSLHVERDVVIEDPFRRPLLLELAESSASARQMAQGVLELGATHLLFNEHEASRIARMTRRARYFATDDVAAEARLREFLRTCLDARFSSGPVAIYELDPTCGVAASGEPQPGAQQRAAP